MSCAHFSWFSSGSTDSPMIFTPRRSNSGLMLAMYPSSVEQTGVKSRGWENRTAQESPIQSWNRMRPSVESASKSGASSPMVRLLMTGILRKPGRLLRIFWPARPASLAADQRDPQRLGDPAGRVDDVRRPDDRRHGGQNALHLVDVDA